MKATIKRINQLCGSKCGVYSVYIDDNSESQFELFVKDCENSFKSETKEIIRRLYTIGNQTGAREQFFKRKEGIPGDGVCALYDTKKSKLRLYCIRFGSDLIILGGGGEKPKEIRALQENKNLTKQNYLLRNLSAAFTEAIKEKDIKFSNDRLSLEGVLEFELEDWNDEE